MSSSLRPSRDFCGLDTKPEQRVFFVCREHGLGVLAREPLASSFLTGKYKPGKSVYFKPRETDVFLGTPLNR
jgi:aryl-alcohol dehydrogenase-like predicted oxidoreductase